MAERGVPRVCRVQWRGGFAALLLGALAVGCEEIVIAVVEVATVELTPAAATLAVGDAVQFAVVLRDDAGNELGGRAVEWISDAPSVAAVDAGGRVTAVGSGAAAIIATAEGVSDTARVMVEAEPPPSPPPPPPSPAPLPVPTAPAEVEARGVSPSRIELSWKNSSAHTAEFRIERRRRQGDAWVEIVRLGAGSGRHTDTGLEEETRYHYRIRACNAAGCSPYSKEVSARTRDD